MFFLSYIAFLSFILWIDKQFNKYILIKFLTDKREINENYLEYLEKLKAESKSKISINKIFNFTHAEAFVYVFIFFAVHFFIQYTNHLFTELRDFQIIKIIGEFHTKEIFYLKVMYTVYIYISIYLLYFYISSLYFNY